MQLCSGLRAKADSEGIRRKNNLSGSCAAQIYGIRYARLKRMRFQLQMLLQCHNISRGEGAIGITQAPNQHLQALLSAPQMEL